MAHLARTAARAAWTTTVIIAGIAILGGCSVTKASAPETPQRAGATGAVTASADADVFAIKVGDCLTLRSVDATEVDSMPVVPCGQVHDSEVFAQMTLTGDTFPGVDSIQATLDGFCADEFGRFVGLEYGTSTLSLNYVYPTEDSWTTGDRLGQCIVIDPSDGGRTGTMKGAGI